MNRIITIVSVIAFCVIFAISGYKLYSIYAEYEKGSKQYEDIAEQFSKEKEEENSQAADGDKEQTPDTSEDLLAQTVPIQIDFDELTQANPDVVGWIYLEGTEINYPILQGQDNDIYLHQLFDGSYNKSGSIFMDFRCDPTFAMNNTLIYGHHMKNNSMFGRLHDYTKQKYYDKHPLMWILTPEKNYKVVLVAGYNTDETDSIYDSDMEPESIGDFVANAIKKSTFKAREDFLATEEVQEASQIVTLSTCSYEQNNGRYLVVGYLIEE